MTGRERIDAALSATGADEIPVVVTYPSIFARDHWAQVSERPWFHRVAPDVERQAEWRLESIRRLGDDWFFVDPVASRAERANLDIEERGGGEVFLVNRADGSEKKIEPPVVGGPATTRRVERLVETTDEIDTILSARRPEYRPETVAPEGRDDLARRLIEATGDALCPVCKAASPFWIAHCVWGVEGMMSMVAERPDLVGYATRRALELQVARVGEGARLGASVAFVEECLTDMIAPEAMASLAMPHLRALIDAIHGEGMKAVHYYTGNPAGKWDLLFDSGADALALEEGKKGFAIDIADVAERCDGRMALFGNLDAVGVLQNGSEADLRDEIARQVAAGRRNGSRFVVSPGSPVTPPTPIERVRRFVDLAREIGRGVS